MPGDANPDDIDDSFGLGAQPASFLADVTEGDESGAEQFGGRAGM